MGQAVENSISLSNSSKNFTTKKVKIVAIVLKEKYDFYSILGFFFLVFFFIYCNFAGFWVSSGRSGEGGGKGKEGARRSREREGRNINSGPDLNGPTIASGFPCLATCQYIWILHLSSGTHAQISMVFFLYSSVFFSF